MPEDNNPLMQIKEVIDSNVRYATIDDLKRGGNRRFKVMKMEHFYSMVQRAVNNVIRSESLTLAAEEKQRLIEESDHEFKRLLGERQGELRDLQMKEEELLHARREVDRLTVEAQAVKDRKEVIAGELRASESRFRTEIEDLAAAKQALTERNESLAKEIGHLQERAREANESRAKQEDQARAIRMIETRVQTAEHALETERLKSRTLTEAHEETSRKLRSAEERVHFLEDEQTRIQRAFENERTQAESLQRALTEAQTRIGEESELEGDLKRLARQVEMMRAERETLENALTETREKALTAGRKADEERRKLLADLQEVRADATQARDLLSAEQKKARMDILGSRTAESQLAAECEAEKTRRATLEADLADRQQHLEEMQRRHDESTRQARAEADRLRATIATLEKAVEESRRAQTEAKQRLDDAHRDAEARAMRLRGLEERRDLDRTELQEALDRLRERDEAIRSVQERIEETEARARERAEEVNRVLREKERLEDLVHERGEMSREMRRLEEKLSDRDEDLRRARERFAVLEEKNRELDEKATDAQRTESEAVETAGRYRARVETALHALEEREEMIATLKEHIGHLTTLREAHDSEQAKVRAGLDRLGEEIRVDRENRESDREILEAEAHRQEALLEEMGTLRGWLEKRLKDDGRALKAIRAGVRAVNPLADEIGAIKDMLSESGGPGAQSERLIESLEASIGEGIERIETELVERIESIKRSEAAESAAKAIEAAEIDLDRLFIHDFDIETNLEAIGVRSANTGSIDGNLEKLRRLKGPGAPGDDSAPEDC